MPQRPIASRVPLAVASLLAVVVCLALAWVAAFASWLGTCDGDGGYPFAAPVSPAGRLCSSSWGTVYADGQLMIPIVVMLVFGAMAVVRARWQRVALGVVLSVASIVTMFAVMGSLPRDCTQAQSRTLDYWDCATY